MAEVAGYQDTVDLPPLTNNKRWEGLPIATRQWLIGKYWAGRLIDKPGCDWTPEDVKPFALTKQVEGPQSPVTTTKEQ